MGFLKWTLGLDSYAAIATSAEEATMCGCSPAKPFLVTQQQPGTALRTRGSVSPSAFRVGSSHLLEAAWYVIHHCVTLS